MTHPNFVTNGSSLEDCHTNFFALADLCGIKWRHLTCESSSVEPFEDPVLSSYCKCLAADLLCVWRRVKTEPNGRQFNDNQNNFTKELWIFWYGEEPDLTDLVHNELQETGLSGSWETGLSYECRTLLFKALHNLIERCLLSRGFARLGRWFFQPTDTCTESTDQSVKNSTKRSSDGTQLTFAFNFFVHGDSTVCANVDVRQHPAVYRITKADLHSAQTSQNGIRVVLGPYGMAGVLTGQSYKDTDPSVQKVLNEWKQIYPLTQMSSSKDTTQGSAQPNVLSQHFGSDINSNDFGANSSNSVNRVVEVIVSGFRMKYPFCYVFVTDIDHKTDEQKTTKCYSNKTNSKSVTNVSEIVPNDSFGNSKPILCPYQQQIPTHTYLLKNCVSHELSLSQQKALDSTKLKELSEETADNLLLWNVTDPCIKNNCNCFRCKAKKASNVSSKSSNTNSYINQMSGNKKGDKTDKESRNKGSKSVPPFHRRSPVLNASIELINGLTNSTLTSSASNSGGTAANPSVSSSISQPTSVLTYSYKSPISGGGLPSLQSSAATPSGVNGVDSPHSVAQSLILDGQTSSVEQNNLSVSPHPIKEELTNCNEAQLMTNSGPSPLSNNRTRLEQLLSPNNPLLKGSVNANNISDDSPSIQMNQWTPGGQSADTDSNTQIPVSESNTTAVNSNSNENSNQTHQNSINGVKRPSLAICTYEDNDCDPMRNGLLYDYSHLSDLTDIWDIPAPKNRRKNTFNDFRRLSVNDYYFSGRKRLSPGSQINGEFTDSQLMPKPKDPYEFNDYDEEGVGYKVAQNGITEEVINESTVKLECSAPSPELNPNSNSQTNRDNQKTNSNELSATPPQLMKVFTKETELVPSYRDLDQIFDTSSGEDSNDETFQPPLTPSGVNSRVIAPNTSITGVNPLEEHSKSNKNSSAANLQMASMAELARMFPTPPSLEPMAPSPCGNFIGTDATIIDDISLYPCSPNMIENSKDWSYVYKPPIQCQVIASSKYAPLPNIPNLPTIPKECKYEQSMPTLPTPVANNNPIQAKSVSVPNQAKSASNHYNHITPLKQNASNFMSHPMSRSSHPYSQMRMRPNLSPVPNQFQQMPNPNGIQHLQHIHGSHPQHSHPSLYVTQADGSHVPHSPLPHYHPNYNPNDSLPAPHAYYGNANPYGGAHRSPHPATSPVPGMHFNSQNPYMARNHLPQEHMSSVPSFPEAHSLVVNLMLSDSLLNLFKDHNFESCSLCVCNMNIKGNDVGVYLPDQLLPGGCDEAQYRCTCGFSAVVNRHRSHFAGLFYEDEVDITGLIYDPCDGLKKKNLAAIESSISDDNTKENKENSIESIDQSIIDLIITQTTNVLSSCSVLSKAFHYDIIKDRLNGHLFSCEDIGLNKKVMNTNKLRNQSILNFRDGSQITFAALLSAKMSTDNMQSKHLIPQNYSSSDQNKNPLHEWSFRTTKFPVNNQEVIRLLRQLQPLMQESVQRKKTKMWEVTYTVSGPLTWRQFHRLAGRGTEDQCEPQPIPSLLVGYDKDCVALSPFALKYWEKLSLEPYSLTRDIAYVVVSPENDYIISHVKTFFKELSTTYEMLRLGRHCPITKVLRDGILRVGTRTAKKLADEPIDDWFNQIGDGSVATKLKLYAQACRHQLSPHLSTQTLDKSLFESNASKQSNDSTNGNNSNNSTGIGGLNSANCKPSNSPMPNTDPNNEKVNDENLNESSSQHSSHSQQPNQREEEQDEDPHKQPAIVIYIIEPFTYGSVDKELYRLSSVGLLRCYTQIIRYLPENLKNSIHLQLISLDSLLNNGRDLNGSSRLDQLKDLSLSVFSQCRQQLLQQSTVKSLTGFGPAAMFDLFLKSKDPATNISRVYTPPFILAPLKDKQTELGEMFGDRRERSQILYCCYCLTEDQRWLLASVTNDKGDLLETTSINIEIPNRTRRRKASVRRFGLNKLMRFVQTVMSESVTPWRLVIGRLGRIGHGELKDWASLLSKKSLLRFSRELREMCSQCSHLSPFDQPAVFSACLISLEADTTLRVFPDHYTPDERFSSSCNTCSLSTPEDASCTHILVFPTSATTQSSHGSFSIDPLGALGANIGEDDILQALDEAVEDDINVNDIFSWTESSPQSPGQGHGDLHPDSPGNRQGGYGGSGSMKISNNFGVDIQDEPTQLLQQPLALAFYVSTAKTGPLPRWFWSSCPHMETSCPVFLKSALLIHTPSVQQNSDDFLHSNIRNYHSLDSNLTTDVLRCVLEGYNALSWLSLDPSTHDRTSCLPIHIQLLMQLYHTVQALV